jgi:thioesterase domain-containing protein
MRRAAAGFALAAHPSTSPREAQTASHARPETVTDSAIREGMSPAEGIDALDRVLAIDFAPRVVVCTVPLQPWLAELDRETRGPEPRPDAAAEDATVEAAANVVRPDTGTRYVAPRSSRERELAALWSSILGVANIGVHDDFFELGGHSLIAVRMLGKVKKRFGVDLALEAIFRAPTIATCAELLAAELGDEPEPMVVTPTVSTALAEAEAVAAAAHAAATRPRASWSPLVPIQVGGSRTPFFCVHGAGGNVLNLRDLARRLGTDQPFYGLQAQGVDGKLPPLRRVEDMAALYLSAIRDVQPHGPYLLGGYSGGGVVAFEIAQRLSAAGEDVRFLGFLDTFCPVQPRRAGVGALLEPLTLEARARLAADLVVRATHWRPAWWPGLEFGWKQARLRWLARRGATIPHDLREFALYEAFTAAHEHYRPTAYSGRVTLWSAREQNARLTWIARDLGWGPYVDGGVDVQIMPGNHQSLILEPNVQLLVTGLRAALDRAAADHAAAPPAEGRPLPTDRLLSPV